MPGVLGISARDDDLSRVHFNYELMRPLVVSALAYPHVYIARFTNAKFIKDKVFGEDDDVCVALDGVIFNFGDLRCKLGGADNFDTVKKMYKQHGDTFFTMFCGEFGGLIYDKGRKRWVVFTNYTGTKPIYYYYQSGLFICSSQFDVVTQVLRTFQRKFTLDVFGAYCLLTYGGMLEDYTLVADVKKLVAGHYLVLDGDRLVVARYHRFSNERETKEPLCEILERFDSLFKQAVVRQYDKDREYGYDHIATLSGGLDSRMNLWVAHELGYRPQVALTFSQNDYLDDRISKRITTDLKVERLFYSLDTGQYLQRVFPYAVRSNGGLVLFSGSAHLLAALNRVDTQRVGMLHTGMIGDAVMGSFLKSPEPTKPRLPWGAYSSYLLDRIRRDVDMILGAYETEELFLLYNRAFNTAFNGIWTAYHFTECSSPFIDVDVLSYGLQIPRHIRFNEQIHRHWILAKHPKASRYMWERTKTKIQHPMWMQKITRSAWYLATLATGRLSKLEMNPFWHWYRTNEELRKFFQSYWEENRHVLDGYPELRRDASAAFERGSSFLQGPLTVKSQVLTLLEAIKLHWA